MEVPSIVLFTQQQIGAVTLQRIHPDLPVSVRGVSVEAGRAGRGLPGSGTLSAAVHAQNLLKEVSISSPPP